jgi:hypothetical protein
VAEWLALVLVLLLVVGGIALALWFHMALMSSYYDAVREDEELEAAWVAEKAENDKRGWPTVPRNRVYWGSMPIRRRDHA